MLYRKKPNKHFSSLSNISFTIYFSLHYTTDIGKKKRLTMYCMQTCNLAKLVQQKWHWSLNIPKLMQQMKYLTFVGGNDNLNLCHQILWPIIIISRALHSQTSAIYLICIHRKKIINITYTVVFTFASIGHVTPVQPPSEEQMQLKEKWVKTGLINVPEQW